MYCKHSPPATIYIPPNLIVSFSGCVRRSLRVPYNHHVVRHERPQKVTGEHLSSFRFEVYLILCNIQLSRKDSSSKSNKTEKTSSSASNGTPPPPPPNNAKPQLPQIPTTASSSLNISFGGNNAGAHPNAGSSNGAYGARTGAQAGAGSGSGQTPAAPDRRFSQPDRASPAPPIVVVSPDTNSEANARGGYVGQERTSLTGDTGSPMRSTAINRLRQTPKDTIPIIGKPPRKQRSSRFVPSEKVEIERLPPFSGELYRDYQRTRH